MRQKPTRLKRKPGKQHKKIRNRVEKSVPANRFERWVLNLVNYHQGYRILMAIYAPCILAPASLSYFGKYFGWLGIALCVLMFILAVYTTERFIKQVNLADPNTSITRRFIGFVSTGLALSTVAMVGTSLLL